MPLNQRKPLRSSDKKDVEDVSGDGKRQNEEKDGEEGDDTPSTSTGGSTEEEEEEGLECSLVAAGQRRCSGRLTATAQALRFVPHSDPDRAFEVAYTRVAWAGWQMAGRGSRGENGGFLHFELLPFAPSHSTRPAGNARRGGRRGSAKGRRRSDGVDELEGHKFAHFAAGGPRMGRNPRLRAIVTDIRRLSSPALDCTSSAPRPPPLSLSSSTSARPQAFSASKEGIIARGRKAVGVPSRPRGRHTIVLGSDGEEDRIEVDVETGKKAEEGDQGSEEDRERENESDENEEDEEEEGTDEDEEEGRGGGMRIERVGRRGEEPMHGVVRGGAGMCRVHLTPTAIVQLDRRPFVVVPYSEIEVACLERALFKPALRNFDLALVKKSVRQLTATTEAKPKARRRKHKKRTTRDSDDDDGDEEGDVIESKAVGRYVAQVHSIPMEYLARLENKLSAEGVEHHRGLGNVQWPPLLNFVKDNPAEFERTGGWTEYLKPEREEKKGKERKGVSDDDGDSDDDEYGGGEEGMWGGYGGEDDEESDGEFMPEAALLNASYSEIDEADDADSPRLKRKRSQREKSVPPENSPPKSKRTKGEPESDEKTTEKREVRIKERSDADGEGRVMTRTGLAALLMEASEHDEVQLVPLVSKKERRKRKAASGQQRREIVDSEGEAKVKRAEARTVGGEEKSERKRTRTNRGSTRTKGGAEAKTGASAEKPTKPKRKAGTPAKKESPALRASAASSDSDEDGEQATTTTKRRRRGWGQPEEDSDFQPDVQSSSSSSVSVSASSSSVSRNERVRQRQFSGYNTRARQVGKAPVGPQDKIIRLDPPTRRRKRTAAVATNNSEQPTVDRQRSTTPLRMKAEAEVVDLTVSEAGTMTRVVPSSGGGDGEESFSGDESASQLDDSKEGGYESEESSRHTDCSVAPAATGSVVHQQQESVAV